MSNEPKETKLEKKLEELQEKHEWSCVHHLSKAFPESGNGIDWGELCKASYHAGAAKLVYEATF